VRAPNFPAVPRVAGVRVLQSRLARPYYAVRSKDKRQAHVTRQEASFRRWAEYQHHVQSSEGERI
jgi:hypothetical protein